MGTMGPKTSLGTVVAVGCHSPCPRSTSVSPTRCDPFGKLNEGVFLLRGWQGRSPQQSRYRCSSVPSDQKHARGRIDEGFGYTDRLRFRTTLPPLMRRSVPLSPPRVAYPLQLFVTRRAP